MKRGELLFLSDVHLESPDQPAFGWLCETLAAARQRAAAVYILGDLFEAWIGDDAPGAVGEGLAPVLAALPASGVPVFFLHGNRDFLLGERYAAASGMTLLDGPAVITIGTARVLALHGDELCTGDTAYQAFRAEVRDPAWQRAFLTRPAAERRDLARRARDASSLATAGKPAAIMDVEPATVSAWLARHAVQYMIHGHTHRPALHRTTPAPGVTAWRRVLGAWENQAMAHWIRPAYFPDPQAPGL